MGTVTKGTKSVFGIFSSRAAVETTIDRLKADGFRSSDISVLMSDGNGDLATEKGTKAPEGVTTGVASGALLGGAFGWLVGVGTLAIPGAGPLIAAGPLMAALAGVGVGATLGGVTGALIGMGIPEFEAKRFEGLIKDGGILLSVHVDDAEWSKKARRILEMSGARDIATASEHQGSGTEDTDDRTFKDLPPPSTRF